MSDAPTEPELRAFVGANAPYYLRAWNGTGRRFNFAAFFFGVAWLAYRKMYGLTFLFVLLGLGLGALDGLVLEKLAFEMDEKTFETRINPVWMAVWVASFLVLPVACGVCGNRWYLGHARGVIGNVRALRLDEKEHLTLLAARGGASLGPPLVLLGLVLLALCVLPALFLGAP